MSDSNLLFNDIEVVEVNGERHIPTALYYTNNDYEFGTRAEQKSDRVQDLNLGFKMDLGGVSEKKKNRTKKKTASDSRYIDAKTMSGDFISSVLDRTIKKIPSNKNNTTIVMAEPIAIEGELAEDRWLSKYRRFLREILSDQGYDDVQFMPEPFAVYQYYRYGINHPALSHDKKYNALVIDFGAGTLDTCIINTTKEGDISGGGRNSRPLAAAAEKVGGYYINEELAIRTYLRFFKNQDRSQSRKFKDFLSPYRNRREGKVSKLVGDNKVFYDNMRDIVHRIEKAKITLSRRIDDWSLEKDLSDRVPMKLPGKPWEDDSEVVQTYVTASNLKDIFINKVWKNEVETTIRKSINRSEQHLKGKTIDRILLSGGTCNLGWLPKLIEREIYSHDLVDYAEIITIPGYREVVSKGLAIECARQFYTESNRGDFAETMYNSLNLLLDPKNEGVFDVNKFKPQSGNLPDLSDAPHGTLLPSATDLSDLVQNKLRWKVSLSGRPSNRLDYKFLNSSLDPEDHEHVLNHTEQFIDTPQEFKDEGGWDNYTTVQIKIEKDGTVYPTFIYQKENDYADGKKVDGRPFTLADLKTDLEAGGDEDVGYIGLDFGTSNTALSYIDERTIEVYNKRSNEPGFSDFQELKNSLPFPLARPLADYLSAPEDESREERARYALETAFNILTSVGFIEIFAVRGPDAFKNISIHDQVSIGQTWGVTKQVIDKLPDESFIGQTRSLLEGSAFQEVDQTVTQLSREKHGKKESVKSANAIEYVYNSIARALNNIVFGFFDSVSKVGSRRSQRYNGRFRVAHGHGRPFTESLHYTEGNHEFAERSAALLIDTERSSCLELSPFVFWRDCPKHASYDSGHCFTFDKFHKESKQVEYKSVSESCVITAPDEDYEFNVNDKSEWMIELQNGGEKEYFEIINNVQMHHT